MIEDAFAKRLRGAAVARISRGEGGDLRRRNRERRVRDDPDDAFGTGRCRKGAPVAPCARGGQQRRKVERSWARQLATAVSPMRLSGRRCPDRSNCSIAGCGGNPHLRTRRSGCFRLAVISSQTARRLPYGLLWPRGDRGTPRIDEASEPRRVALQAGPGTLPGRADEAQRWQARRTETVLAATVGHRLEAKLAAHLGELEHKAGRRSQPDSALFSFRAGRAIHPCTIARTFHRAVTADPAFSPPPGVSAPRLHCLRHSFAVGTLLRWYRAGVDVSARLIHLSTFLGIGLSPGWSSRIVRVTETSRPSRSSGRRNTRRRRPRPPASRTWPSSADEEAGQSATGCERQRAGIARAGPALVVVAVAHDADAPFQGEPVGENPFEGAPVCLVIGFLLGGMLESSLRQSMLLYKSDFGVLLESPIAIVFLLLTLVMLARAARRARGACARRRFSAPGRPRAAT